MIAGDLGMAFRVRVFGLALASVAALGGGAGLLNASAPEPQPDVSR